MLRALLALALLAVPASAAAKDPWLRLTSPHFELFTDAGERAGREVARHFEQVHGFFLQRFKTGIDPNRKARVLLFRNEKEYAAYRPNQFAAAFYHPGETRDFIVLNNAEPDWKPTAVHELTHLMVHQLGTDLPLWLNEGLAELYSNMEPRGSQVMVGRDIPGRMHVLSGEPWLPLPALLAVDHESSIYNGKSRAPIFYAESWKLVHMLHLSPAYEPHLTDFVRALLKGDAAGAFQTAYGKDLETVERDLRAYLAGGTITAMLFDIPLPKSVEAPEIEPSASIFARLAIAELLSNTSGRSGEAVEAYRAIARDFPGRWEVEEAMGLFAWRERRMTDADQHFAKAEQLGCNNGSTFLLWGRVLGYNNRPPDAVTALGKAAALLPDSVEARLAYGDALIRNGSWGAAVAVLREVTSVPSISMWRYSYNLAYGLYKLGELDAAKPLLANARKYASNTRETNSLDQLETALNRGVRIEGVLETLECGSLAKLHVRVGGQAKVFVMPNLSTAVDLPCGPQKNPPRVRIEYQPLPPTSEVAGLIRSLEFQ